MAQNEIYGNLKGIRNSVIDELKTFYDIRLENGQLLLKELAVRMADVTDYINRRAYHVTVSTYNPEGIEDIYSVGEWVNIYDIYGRKVTTTNEDIYQMALPRGVYIVVLENGETFKIMR